MRLFSVFLGIAAILLFAYCQSKRSAGQATAALPYLNLHDSVRYVGMEQCRACHADKFDTFIQTGMGQSFDEATREKSLAKFDHHALVYDSVSNFYYRPFWRGDSLFIKEFRVENGDTTHLQVQYIRYIIGSGQHTNSHIYEENGHLYQAPITFYTQKGIWDLAPGFNGGFNSRFSRIIGQECMSCHNSLSNFVEGSENKFLTVPHGIGCERCHGPGSVHVRQKLAGELVDTASQIDYSIVNPRKLPNRAYQMSVCQRCHLQGVAVLKDQETFHSFRPGRLLSDVMDIYLPEYDGNQTKFIMASQAHRLTKSPCYQASNMTCMTCHNPHISVKQTPRETFNKACVNCHNGTPEHKTVCTLPELERERTNGNDCSGCHMPVSPSIDIPHVTVHDHFIRRPINAKNRNQIENFIALQCANNSNPTPLSRAKGYLHYFESYTEQGQVKLLDSAAHYLQLAEKTESPLTLIEPFVHLHYLQENYAAVIHVADKVALAKIKDGWTAYRVGEAYWQQKNHKKAVDYFNQAVGLLPLQADFSNKLAMAYLADNNFSAAQTVLETLLKEHPKHVSALTNLGFVYVNMGKLSEADRLYQRALALNPDYETALLNLAALQLLRQDKNGARKTLQTVLRKYPNNTQARDLLRQIGHAF